MSSLENWLKNIESLLHDSKITIKSDGSTHYLSLGKDGKSLNSLGNSAGNILPSELSSPILHAFNSLGGSVLKLQEAYLMEASIDTQTATTGAAETAVTTTTTTFSIDVKWKKANWELIHNFLTLENPELKAYLTRTTTGANVSNTTVIYLSGTFNVGGVPIQASLILPEMILAGSISASGSTSNVSNTVPKTYPINPLLSVFGFESDKFNETYLNQLLFSASIRTRVFTIEVGISTDFDFNITASKKLRLTDVGLKLTHVGGTPSSNTITVYGTLEIDKNNYNVSITHDTKAGWSVSGEVTFKDGVSITKPINALTEQFGISNLSLPKSFTGGKKKKKNKIKISKISFTFDQATKGFDIKVEFLNALTISALTNGLISPTPLPAPPPGSPPAQGEVVTAPTHTCDFASIKSSLVDDKRASNLTLKMSAGLHLAQLAGLEGNLPSGFNPVLDEIDFSMDLEKSKGAKKSTFQFTTTFSNGSPADNKIAFSGEYSTSTDKDETVNTSFGGSVYSPEGATFNLNDPNFPIDVAISDLFVAKLTTKKKDKPSTNYKIYGVDLSSHGDIDLSRLPVVGDFFHDAKFSFQALRLIYVKSSDASKTDVSAADLTTINALLSDIHVAPIQTAQNTVNNNSSAEENLPTGFTLQGSLVLGDNNLVIPLHSSIQQGVSGAGESKKLTPSASSSHATPSAVGKKLGPLSIENVSIGIESVKSVSELALTFTGGLQLGPLFLEFIGLKFKSPFTEFSPSVSLDGFGLELSKPPLEVSGMFLETTIPDPNDNSQNITVYNGSLSVGYKQYELVAMGSYAKLADGATSMFIYGFLGAPLGGLPVILMITGVAAGFGYNRTFKLPAPKDVQTYPLIQPVLPGGKPPKFDDMMADFAPQEGSFWGAIGIRVESFKMVEAFLLLDVKFSNELEIDIIGLATMTFPKPQGTNSNKPSLAKIIVGVVARILPERGIITMNGSFQPGSYIYCPEAHVTGSFAMLSVLKDQPSSGQWKNAPEGDFVFTLGGYAPDYQKPGYYPTVPRIELLWNVNSNLNVKGSFYFAITPNAMMAGGSVAGIFQEGGTFSIRVSFLVGADFIIYWQPYHYKAHFYADLHVRASVSIDCWLFTLSASVDMDLNADLNIWGPDFSGHGSVSIHVLLTFSASISFGANQETIAALSWSEFKAALLPKDENILSVNLGKGLVASHSSVGLSHDGTKSEDVFVVNPKELSIVCGSAIPIKAFNSAITGVATPNVNFGIKSMGKTISDFPISKFNVKVERIGSVTTDVTAEFNYSGITKNMPNSLWQPAETSGTVPMNSSASVIPNLTSGLLITAKSTKSTASSLIAGAAPFAPGRTTSSSFEAAYSYHGDWNRA